MFLIFYAILVFECSATFVPENGEDNCSTTLETFTRVRTKYSHLVGV